MKKVVITSLNPVKINAVRLSFESMFPNVRFEFESIPAQSGVRPQPTSDSETYTGALSRVESASKTSPEADYWVGIEGGVEENDSLMEAFAWVVVKDKQRAVRSKTGTFILPVEVAELIRQGKELGEADDIVFKRSNSKQKDGAVGLLTHGVIDRTEYYKHAVILALIAFKNPDLY